MKARLIKVWAWAHTHQGRKVLRFTSVSVISTIVSNLVLLFVYGLRLIPNEIYATLFGNIVATVPSYWLNRSWTWGKRGRSHIRTEIIPFWSMSLLGISFSMIGANLVQSFVKTHNWNNVHHVFATILLAGTNLLSFGIFWLLKLYVFNRIFHVDELAEVEEHLTAEEIATQGEKN